MPKILKKDVDRLLVAERKKMRAGQVTKGDIERLLVKEREKMREAAKQSKFMSRTLSIYKGQVARATELGRPLLYALEEFREYVRAQLEVGTCPYCKCRITVNSFVDDHPTSISQGGEFTLENTVACCKPCNCQKGLMTAEQFHKFNEFLEANLPKDVARDTRARLSTGGKWLGK